MSRLADRIAKRLKSELGLDVLPVIERTYAAPSDDAPARFTMEFREFQVPHYVRFEDTARDVAKAKRLSVYREPLYRGLLNSVTVLIEEA